MIKDLELFAKEIRYYLLKELDHMGFGHYGGSLSIVEALAVIYGEFMDVDLKDPKKIDRNYFVLSKGHAGPALYSVLFLKGFFDEDLLYTLNQGGTKLPSHPNRILTPGVDYSTGSLAQGLSGSTGLAYGLKLLNSDNYVYSIVGDGEMNEGQVWESIQFINQQKLSNLVLFIDNNGKQLDGRTSDLNNQLSFSSKMEAFGLNSIEVDGSNIYEIKDAIHKAHDSKDKPTVIILNTTKGQGVKYIEELESNHHLRPSVEDDKAIKKEIEKLKKELSIWVTK